MIKIIIADDHPIVRAGMKQIIAEASDLKVADEASDGHKLLMAWREVAIICSCGERLLSYAAVEGERLLSYAAVERGCCQP